MNDLPTRERLVAAGCRLFAERGFRDTTVAEICEQAEANIAAVNYHFGDKESLYHACWRHAYATASQTFPFDAGISATSLPSERLGAFITGFMHRVFDEREAGYFPKMMVKEMAEPTTALDAILDEVIEPQKKTLHSIVATLLETKPDDMRVMACSLSVISQCVFFAFSRAMRERRLSEFCKSPDVADRLAGHVTRFCLAGIAAMKAPSA